MNEHHVLIVAANPFSLGLMSDLLAANGIRTEHASLAREAPALAKSLHPTMVIVDMDLPGGGVDQLLGSLRRDPVTRDIPVMTVGEGRERQVAERILGSLGSSLPKPIDTSEFPRTVIQQIRRHSTRASREVEI